MPLNRFLKERTNLRTALVAVSVFVVGIAFLFFSEYAAWISESAPLKATIANLGGLLIATVSLAFLWEVFSKRALLDELLDKARLAEEIRMAGINSFTMVPLKGPNFSDLIRTTSHLDIFVCYATTWRALYETELKALADRQGVHIRVMLPDPNNQLLMADLAIRFRVSSAEAVSERIQTAITDYKRIFASVAGRGGSFSIWLHSVTPVLSFYRFDNLYVLTLYRHARGRGNVPTIVAEKGGELSEFLDMEIKSMVKGTDGNGPLAKQVFPVPAP